MVPGPVTLAGRISRPFWAATRRLYRHSEAHWELGAYPAPPAPVSPPDPVERIVERKEELGYLAQRNQERYLKAVRPALPPYRPHPAAIQVVMDRPGCISLLAPNGVRVDVPERLRTADQLHGWFYEHVVPSLSTDRGASMADLWSRLDGTHAIACRDDTQIS